MTRFERRSSVIWLAMALLALLQGCDCGSTDVTTRRFACTQDTECASGFVCDQGECRAESALPDGGTDGGADGGPPDGGGIDGGPDGGPPDGGPPDGGRPDGGRPDGGPADGGPADAGPDGGVPDGGPAQPTQLSFVSPPQSVTAGQCSAQVVVETRDAMGSPAPVNSATPLFLVSQGDSGFNFFSDSACQTVTTQVTVPAGNSRAAFYFRSTVAQFARVVVGTPSGLSPAFQDETILPGSPAVLVFRSPPQTLLTGACSFRVELEARDAFGNASAFSSQTPVSLVTQPSSGLSFFSNASCVTAITQASFAAGTSRAFFYFKGNTGGTMVLMASASGVTAASQSETILPMVRTGTCTMSSTTRTLTCPISPAQVDISKTLMIFQATSDLGSPAAANVRCSLTSPTAITCYRNTAEGTVRIRWQTAERSSGLKVQHLEASCAGENIIYLPIQPVASFQRTFLLVSAEKGGVSQDADDFYVARLADLDEVELEFDSDYTCSPTWTASVQVVELASVNVTRGETLQMQGTQQIVSNLTPVNPASTVLLFTFNADESSGSGMCDLVVRGALNPNNPTTSLLFTRSAGDSTCTETDIESISWERIDFGTSARAQHVGVEMLPETTTTSVPITAVDVTRTLTFAGGQWQSGQGGGESDYQDDDILGEAVGLHSLTSPTTLEVTRGSGNGTTRWTSTVLQLEP
ncbi:hypothetical protein [Hyalangium gracile]|uniref:hypothetical protein n=1 Tax=Hyalangium gracile TaxID=394092 RepID=UPI001CCEADA1|nr:hypothetical protein [Hyalangium gracile]